MDDRPPAAGAAPGLAAWAVSGLNALFGDYLDARGNGLAVGMALYEHGAPLPLSAGELRAALPSATPRLCLLVHGLGCHEGVWHFPGVPGAQVRTYGTLLQADLGFTPLAVRYNTGLSISRSGELLADLLRDLAAAYPAAVEEIVLIGHSMGGLVIEHAYHLAALREDAWAERVTRVFYLGAPHHGADLARLSHVAEGVLGAIPNPITRLIGGVFALRSQGVKDLSYGATRHHPGQDAAPPPAHATAEHYIIAGSLGADERDLIAQLVGDGLVRPPRPDALPALPPDHIRLLPQIHHIQLAHDERVYTQIQEWVRADSR
jgi:pimeloyl-ACP methyl ester carboxylesterase